MSGESGSQSASPAEHIKLLLLLLLRCFAVSDGNDGRIGMTALIVSIISGLELQSSIAFLKVSIIKPNTASNSGLSKSIESVES